jgi:diguanylate cyclase (GGDEF)-like protein
VSLREKLLRDGIPMARKLHALLSVALVLGMCIGLVEAMAGYRVWPMVLLILPTLGVLWSLHDAWVLAPWQAICRVLPGIQRDEARLPLSVLPIRRLDEVGEVARAIHALASDRIKHRLEAHQLRRTLDQRVADATARATVELNKQAHRDPLTGAGNRRFLDTVLPALVEAARASDTELVCVALDMDYFKQANDQFGHAVGDELLKLLADLLKACVRDSDVVVRLGGDEFVVLLPGAALDRGGDLADSVRRLFSQQSRFLVKGSELRPSLSAGVSALQYDNCEHGKELLEMADRRLYASKRAGRGLTTAP